MGKRPSNNRSIVRRQDYPPEPSSGAPLYARLDQRDAQGSVQEVKKILRRGKWIIIATTLIVVALTGAYLLLSERTYEAYTVLLAEDQKPYGSDAALSSGVVDALGREDARDRGRSLTNQTLLLEESVPLAERVATRMRREQNDIPGDATMLLGGDGEPDSSLTGIARRIMGHVSAGMDGGDALRISAESPNPYEASFLANAYADEYVQYAREMSRRRIDSSRTFLESQLTSRRQELENNEAQIEQYMSQNDATALDAETERLVGQVGSLESRLDEARSQRSRSQAALESAEQELEDIRPRLAERISSGADEEINQAQERLAELQARLDQIYVRNPELQEGDASENETINRLQEQIAGLEERLGTLTEQYISEMMAVGGADPMPTEGGGSSSTYVAQLKQRVIEERLAISGAEAEIDAIQGRLAQYEQRLDAIPEQSVRLAQLRREQAATEEQVLTLNEKLQEVRLADRARIELAEVMRPAFVPTSPVLPRLPLLLAGLILGLGLGIVAAVARYKLDTRVYAPEDLRDRDFEPLGVVPDMHLIGQQNGAEEHTDTTDTALAAPLKASSAITEAFRRLHVNIQFSQLGRDVKTIMITSPEPGAGKSTVTLNLALTAARSGRRTLIIDADLRRPKIYSLLNKTSGPFLSDLLENGTVDPEELSTGFDNLYAVTTRVPLADADVVLNSQKMNDLIERLRSAFDVIIFDTPPVLSVADAAFLCSRCDATVVVASAGQTKLEALEQTTEELYSADAEIIGTVLNRFDPSESSRDTYKYRYRDYGYGTVED